MELGLIRDAHKSTGLILIQRSSDGVSRIVANCWMNCCQPQECFYVGLLHASWIFICCSDQSRKALTLDESEKNVLIRIQCRTCYTTSDTVFSLFLCHTRAHNIGVCLIRRKSCKKKNHLFLFVFFSICFSLSCSCSNIYLLFIISLSMMTSLNTAAMAMLVVGPSAENLYFGGCTHFCI